MIDRKMHWRQHFKDFRHLTNSSRNSSRKAVAVEVEAEHFYHAHTLLLNYGSHFATFTKPSICVTVEVTEAYEGYLKRVSFFLFTCARLYTRVKNVFASTYIGYCIPPLASESPHEDCCARCAIGECNCHK